MPAPAVDPAVADCLELLGGGDPGPRGRKARERAMERLLNRDPDRLFAFLREQRLDQLWYRAVLDLGLESALPGSLAERLREARRAAAARVLLQLEAARRAAGALDDAGLRHVFYKGFLLGEELYGDAVLRPAADVDLLVAEDDRGPAVAALAAAGFAPAPEPDQPGYELTLAGHGVQLDLHWHLLEPARSRRPLTGWVLRSRRRRGGFHLPGTEATLVILLLAPAVTDHVTGRLINAVDLDRWLRRHAGEPDWPTVLELLKGSGLRTAAWAMLEHTRRLLATPVPGEVDRRLAPGPLRRWYLGQWLARDPAGLYRRHPLLVRGGFSLPLQDRPGDVWRALASTLGRRTAARR